MSSDMAELIRDTDAMPEGWRTAPFSALADYVNGRAFKPEDWGTEGLPIIRIAQITNPDAETNFYDGAVDPRNLIDDDDLIFSWSATLAVMRWRKGPAVLNQHLFKVTPAEGIHRDWLQFRLEASIPDLADEAHGTTMKHIRKGTLSSQSTIVPPLHEQRRIAEVLRSVDEAIAAQSALCLHVRQTADDLADELYGREIADSGENLVAYGDACETVQVGIVIKPASYYVDAGGVPALRSTNIKRNEIDFSALVQLSSEGHQVNRKSALRAGDVVTIRTGEPGKTAVIPLDAPSPLNCIDIIFSRPKPELRPYFASYFINSGTARRQIGAMQGGLAQQHFNVGEMKKLKLPVPTLARQDRVIAVLDAAWQAVQVEEAQLATLQSTKTALMSDLLSGRVRVPA